MQKIRKESISFRSSFQQNGIDINNFELDWGIIQSLCPRINVINYKRMVDKLDINNIVSFFIKKLNMVLYIYSFYNKWKKIK